MSEIPQPGPAPIEAPAGTIGWNGCLAVVALLMIAGVGLALMLPAVQRARPAARRSQCKNNLKQIVLALHNYHDTNRAFPPAYTVDADGRPLHSWRTLILPYLDETSLYNSIDLDKPWDDPVNARAAKACVRAYICPSTIHDGTKTVYLANASQSGCFRLSVSRRIAEITDGLSNTILVLEVPEALAVPWMSPNDADEAVLLSLSAETKLHHTGGVHIALGDGAIRFLSASTPIETRRALLTTEAGEPVGEY